MDEMIHWRGGLDLAFTYLKERQTCEKKGESSIERDYKSQLFWPALLKSGRKWCRKGLNPCIGRETETVEEISALELQCLYLRL